MVAAQTLADVAAAYLLNAQRRVDLEESLGHVRQSKMQAEISMEALRVSEARKKGVLDAVPDPVITIDQYGLVVESMARWSHGQRRRLRQAHEASQGATPVSTGHRALR